MMSFWSLHKVYLAPLTSVKKEIYRDKTRANEQLEKSEYTNVPAAFDMRERSSGKRNDPQSPVKHGVLVALDKHSGLASSSAAQKLAQGNAISSNQQGSDLPAHRQYPLEILITFGDVKLGAGSKDQLSRLKQKVRLLPITDDDRHVFWDSMRAYKKMQRRYLESLLLNHSSPMGFNIEAAWSKTVHYPLFVFRQPSGNGMRSTVVN